MEFIIMAVSKVIYAVCVICVLLRQPLGGEILDCFAPLTMTIVAYIKYYHYICRFKTRQIVSKPDYSLMEQEQQNNIQIELSDDIALGIYSNLAIISHSSSEFVVDFIRMMPGIPKAKVQSRIILTPEHAKRLMLALADNVQKYEMQNGEIKMQGVGFVPPVIGPIGEA